MPSVTLDWLHIIALLGAMQGVLLTGVLATKQQNRTANRILAAAVFTFTIGLVTTVYHGARLVSAFPHFLGVGYPLPFVFGPLIYLYAVTASNRDRKLRRTDALHFLLFAIVIILAVPVYLMSGSEKIAFFEATIQGAPLPRQLRFVDPLKFVSGVAYAAATLVYLRQHGRRVKQSYSHIEHVNLRWLMWLGVSAAAIWLLATSFPLLRALAGIDVTRADDYISLAVAAMVYAIGYMGLRQPEVFRYEASDMTTSTAADTPRYERSGLSEFEAAALKHRLLDVMDTNKPWQDPELTLADLADMLSTTPQKVSEVLNSHLGQTFYDFVNGYRVREVQRRMGSGKTLLALAYDAGFASKSTFNEAFKKHTGQTPSAYRRAAVS